VNRVWQVAWLPFHVSVDVMDEGRGLVAEHFLDLETGICLWLGAGVTKHLALAIGGTVPDWNGITNELEAMAGVATPSDASLSNAIDEAANLVTQIQNAVAQSGGTAERDIVSALENAKPRLPAVRYMNM
jgi:hypothetical protein